VTDADREFNGRLIEDLFRLGDRVLAQYGIGLERAVVPVIEMGQQKKPQATDWRRK